MRRLIVIVVLLSSSLLVLLLALRATPHPQVAATGEDRARSVAQRIRPTLERDLAANGLHWGDPVFLRAFKEERQLELWIRQRKSGKFEWFRTWNIAALSGMPGPKMAEGDGQVPEGFYSVTAGLMKPDSAFHLAINIGYPNAYDRAHGRTGSLIMIHGDCVSIGCLAMTDEKIEEIYTLCDAALTGGQKRFRVHVYPFRMSPARMTRETESPWFEFWKELQTGYNWFESRKIPPDVAVKDRRYTFRELNE